MLTDLAVLLQDLAADKEPEVATPKISEVFSLAPCVHVHIVSEQEDMILFAALPLGPSQHILHFSFQNDEHGG